MGEEDGVKSQFGTLCAELNMDVSTRDEAWRSYEQTRQNYTLEGDQLHWLACSLFVACRKVTVPTVANDNMLQGNGVSLTRLLRSCNLSLLNFFSKARKWADMNNLNKTMVEKIFQLERNFTVTNVIFKKYRPIFLDLFNDPSKDPPKQQRSRKQKRLPCLPSEVFGFCWSLFALVKSEYPNISDDLVNSYHLLLSSVDFVYANAVMDQRSDLLKTEEAVDISKNGEMIAVDKPPCVLDRLCAKHDGIINEVKSIREHFWKPYIKKLMSDNTLRGDSLTMGGILDKDYFEVNFKNVRKKYEAYVLSIGDYDERVFLGEEASSDIGTPVKPSSGPTVHSGQSDVVMGHRLDVAKRNLDALFGSAGASSANLSPARLIPSTPLSGRHYLAARTDVSGATQHATPIRSATGLVSQLIRMLSGRKAEPSPELAAIFNKCSESVGAAIKDRIERMGQRFCERYVAPSDNQVGDQEGLAHARLEKGQTLYYRILEKILIVEEKIARSITTLLEQDVFHQALFTACLEIVMFSYNNQRTFPWILDVFQLEAFYFYKVIEVTIRSEPNLARDVVKHLQRIEEQILESRAWAATSPVWESIRKCEDGVPSCEDVSLPATPFHPNSLSAVGHLGSPLPLNMSHSPISHHKPYFSLLGAGDRFKSPVVTGLARRQLFSPSGQNNTTEGNGARELNLDPPLFSKPSISLSDDTASKPLLSVPPGSPLKRPLTFSPMKPPAAPVGSSVMASPARVINKPRKTGSLSLFFRKVYHLAHLRLTNLCNSMEMQNEEIKQKIWTCFEYTLMKHTDIMLERHLDQIIMCSLYIVCKVSGKTTERNFTDIMKHYRNQPQAASHVYRSVLLRRSTAEGADNGDFGKPNPSQHPPPTPTRMANTSTVGKDGEERGDLIKFYNTVYMERMQDFALRFRRHANQPPMSPLPQLRAQPTLSPCRKVSDNHSVYIRAMQGSGNHQSPIPLMSPNKSLTYSISKSPAKELAAINEMVRAGARKYPATGVAAGKRLQMDLDATDRPEDPTAPKLVRLTAGPNVKPETRTNQMVEILLGERVANSN